MSIPEQDAHHLATLEIGDLFAPGEFSEPLITCLDIVRAAVLDGYRMLVVSTHVLAWSGGPSAPDSFRIPAPVRPLVRDILQRDQVLARYVRPAGRSRGEDHYDLGPPEHAKLRE